MTTKLEAKRNLEQILRDKSRILGDLREKIAYAEKRKHQEKVIEELKAKLVIMEGTYARAIDRANVALDHAAIDDALAAESNAKQIADRSRRAQEEMKNKARISYINNGGSPESFEDQWPALQKRLLEDRVSKDVAADTGHITL